MLANPKLFEKHFFMIHTTPVHYKLIALVSLTFQNANQILLSRYSLGVLNEKYLKQSSLLMTEIMKFICSFLLGWYFTCLPQNQYTTLQYIKQILKTSYLMAPVALIYYIQNYLQYYALKHLPAPVYAVIVQLKILSSAVFFVIFLGKNIYGYQWRALIILALGVALVQFTPRIEKATPVLSDSISEIQKGMNSLSKDVPIRHIPSLKDLDLESVPSISLENIGQLGGDIHSSVNTKSAENTVDESLTTVSAIREAIRKTHLNTQAPTSNPYTEDLPIEKPSIQSVTTSRSTTNTESKEYKNTKTSSHNNPNDNKQNNNYFSASAFKGLISGITVATLSGLAGVYFEFVLKGIKSDLFGVWERNFQLSFCSIFFSILTLIPERNFILKEGVFGGFSIISWMCVANMALGGLLVGAVIQYADSILKNFASSVAIVITALVSIYAFNNAFSFINWIGTFMVIAAVFLYSQTPKELPYKIKT